MSSNAQSYVRKKEAKEDDDGTHEDEEAKEDDDGTHEDDETPLLDPLYVKPKGVSNDRLKGYFEKCRKKFNLRPNK